MPFSNISKGDAGYVNENDLIKNGKLKEFKPMKARKWKNN